VTKRRHTTLGSFLEDWLTGIQQRIDAGRGEIRQGTLQGYRDLLRLHAMPVLAQLPLDRLTPREIQDMLDRVTRKDGRPGPVAAATVRQVRVALHLAMQQALLQLLVVRNPVDGTHVGGVQPSKRPYLDADEARAFITAIEGDPLEVLLYTALMTGMRQGEMLGLPWPNVDFAAREIRIRQDMDPRTGKIDPVKTRASIREVAMPDLLVLKLRTHRARQAESRLAGRRGRWQAKADLVFTTSTGRPYSSANLNRALRRLLTKAGLDTHVQPGNLMRFHDLRKSAASILSAMGFSIPEIMAILGHKTMRMTAEVYAQAHPRNRRAADAFDRLFSKAQAVPR
jgi:integrase